LTALLASALLAAALSASAFVPVDEAARDAEFFAFRARLQAAVARHDTAAVMACVDRNVRTSFGEDNGIDAFRRSWTPGAPDTKLWEELGALFALGGVFQGDSMFVAPYTFSCWPESLDAFTHAAVIGSRVRVRASASPEALVLGEVSFAIVPVRAGGGHDGSGWTPVEFEGRSAYLASAYVRSPIDYRAFFARSPGGWRLVTLVAGD